MGQKVDPRLFRLSLNSEWSSVWFAEKDYAAYLLEDIEVRKIIKKLLKDCGIGNVVIERSLNNVRISIYTAKPGMIIGKKGDNIDKIKSLLDSKFGRRFEIDIKEIKNPDLNAELVGQNIVRQIEKRMPYRRAIKPTIERVVENGAIGAKVKISGRLNGVEIARREFFKVGNIPLHTIRADIDYAKVNAHTTYGIIGLQIWIYKGEKFKTKEKKVSK